jgi:SP family general alpha glucoside:H+ symporter-like MFS transporter
MEIDKEKVVPNERELTGFDLNDPVTVELIHHAQESDKADRLLTVREALKKYKKAVFWAMFLSTSLIMEGYDLVIVRTLSLNTQLFSDHLVTSLTTSV